MTAQASATFTDQFTAKLTIVDKGVAHFIKALHDEVASENTHVQAIIGTYISLLERGGKRTRGALTVAGYEIMHGQDNSMIGDAAGIMEAFHAYLLVGDDITDVSILRRGEPTAHIRAEGYFTDQKAQGNASKFGTDTAQLAALYAQHAAQRALLQLDVSDQSKLVALGVVNDGLARTSIGQILDTLAVAFPDTTTADIEKVAMYKTAYYSYLLPLQLGASLGGASPERLKDFTDYSMHAGYAFQLQDDIIGIFGSETVTGKPRKGDIIEGKKTLLMTDTLAHASADQQSILRAALGNTQLTDADFEQCLNIIESTGAKQRTTDLIEMHVQQAIKALDVLAVYAPPQSVQFLSDMAIFGAQRKS